VTSFGTVQAVTVFQRAIIVHDESSDQWGKAIALTTLGDTLHDNDQMDAARAHWRQALSIFEKLGARQAVEIRARLKIPQAEKFDDPN
jgi:predicted negative regulator of RcsB-dependent stress response